MLRKLINTKIRTSLKTGFRYRGDDVIQLLKNLTDAVFALFRLPLLIISSEVPKSKH